MLKEIPSLIDKMVCEVKQNYNHRTKGINYGLSKEKPYCLKNILKTALRVRGKPLQRMELSALNICSNQPYLIFNDANNSSNAASCFVYVMLLFRRYFDKWSSEGVHSEIRYILEDERLALETIGDFLLQSPDMNTLRTIWNFLFHVLSLAILFVGTCDQITERLRFNLHLI